MFCITGERVAHNLLLVLMLLLLMGMIMVVCTFIYYYGEEIIKGMIERDTRR